MSKLIKVWDFIKWPILLLWLASFLVFGFIMAKPLMEFCHTEANSGVLGDWGAWLFFVLPLWYVFSLIGLTVYLGARVLMSMRKGESE
jgi:hypothetical protein